MADLISFHVGVSSHCGRLWIRAMLLCLLYLATEAPFAKAAGASSTTTSAGTLDENGTISLLVFAPFTDSGIPGRGPVNLGFSHMAGALLAIDHFNQRNAELVPGLERLSCNLTFGNRREIYDTGTEDHIAAKALLQSVQENGGVPTAMAGTFNEIPSTEVSVMATSMEIPMVSHRGTNFRLVLPKINPFFTQVNPNAFYDMEIVASYLDHIQRTNYIAVLYSMDDGNAQRVEALRVLLEGKRILTEAYFSSADYLLEGAAKSVHDALRKIQQSGFRTIVLLTPHYAEDFPILAQAAEDLQLNTGRHVWIHGGVVDLAQADFMESASTNSVMKKFVQGSAVIMPVDQWLTEVNADFFRVWQHQNASLVERLNNWFPLRDEWNMTAPDDYFQTVEPSLGTAFLYDAIMAIGLGACRALESTTTLSGHLHHEAIQQLNFTGSTGHVYFNGPNDVLPSSRVGSTVTYGVINLHPNGNVDYVLTDVVGGAFDSWKQIEPFVYPDGSNTPPKLLRDTPNQNYLSPGFRAFGLSLMSFVLFAAFASAVWIFWHRKHHVVKAGQPIFLYCLLLGSSLIVSTIIPSSFDESYGWSNEMLDKGCIATPWLAMLGQILTYSALFTKLWRINKVLQFRRRQILIRHVAWPMVTLFIAAVGLLSVWTVMSNIRWERKEINAFTGESIGLCAAEDGTNVVFIVIPGVLIMIPMIMTLFMAYKTKDIDATYAESSWIFILVLTQMQVILVGVPIVVILQDVSTDGRYFGESTVVATMSMSAIALMILPRMLAHRRALREAQASPRGSSTTSQPCRRGTHGRVSVSGIATAEDPRQKQQSEALRQGLDPGEKKSTRSHPNMLSTLEEGNGSNGSKECEEVAGKQRQ